MHTINGDMKILRKNQMEMAEKKNATEIKNALMGSWVD